MRDMVKTGKMLAGYVALTPLVLMCSACATIPDMVPPPSPLDAADLATSSLVAHEDGDAGSFFPADSWWNGLGDPQLSALIEEGLANSPSVDLAAARLATAEAQAMQAGGTVGPSAVIEANGGGQSISQNQGFPPGLIPGNLRTTGRMAGSVFWDPDLWGRNRAALSAARGQAAAARVDAAQARLVLSTGITSIYARLAGQMRLVVAAQQALDTSRVTARLTAGRVEAGLDNRGALAMAEASVAQAEASLHVARQDELVLRHALAAMLGAGPDRGLAIAQPSLSTGLRVSVPASLPLDLIGRRPDIVSARLRVEAAAARIGAARADFYPSINLSAVVGLQSIGLADLVSGNSLFSSLGPALRLPLFAQAGTEGRYREARAGYDQAVAHYDETLLDALREVADALGARRAGHEQLSAANDGLVAASEARRIAELRYREGLTSQLPLLVADQQLVIARRTVAVAESQSLSADVALIRALGGGFSQSNIPQTDN